MVSLFPEFPLFTMICGLLCWRATDFFCYVLKPQFGQSKGYLATSFSSILIELAYLTFLPHSRC